MSPRFAVLRNIAEAHPLAKPSDGGGLLNPLFLYFVSGWNRKLHLHMGSVNSLTPYIVAEMQTSCWPVNPLPFNHRQAGLSFLAEFGLLIICG